MSKHLKIFIDGACHGNPGPAGIGVVIFENDKLIEEFSKPIGDATNNIAEYNALIYGLTQALHLKADHVTVLTDSQLVCRQVTGVYKIKSVHLKFLYDQAVSLLKAFKTAEVQHIPREQNEIADRLAARSLKTCKSSPDDRPEVFFFGEESPSSAG